MVRPVLLISLVLIAVFPAASQSQQNQPSPGNTTQEFPVILQQNIVAGKTPVGTKVQAKLSIATLVNGTVVPRNAVFSGEVIESAAKTKNAPSRLSLRMDSVAWKNGSAAIKLYVTAWFYPIMMDAGPELQYGPTKSAQASWNGAGEYPTDRNMKSYKPFPDGQQKDSTVPDTPNPVTSTRRVLMKNVESGRASDGGVELVSKKSNIKLERYTTYVLAATDLVIAK
jgi:hypothetical protein